MGGKARKQPDPCPRRDGRSPEPCGCWSPPYVEILAGERERCGRCGREWSIHDPEDAWLSRMADWAEIEGGEGEAWERVREELGLDDRS